MSLIKLFRKSGTAPTSTSASISAPSQQSIFSTKQEQKLLQLTYYDRACVHRLIEYERRISPTDSDKSLCQDAIDRLIRDRQ